MKPTTLLVILDGWGHREATTFNAIHHARTPTWDRLWHEHPHALLECSGEHVGLPDGQMGNSEVGHITIGAGRIVRQELNRIDHSIADGSFAQNPALQAVTHSTTNNTLHVIGLLSPGGVHSHENHIVALIRLALAANRRIALHAILDGRDTPPQSAEASLRRVMQLEDSQGYFKLASICGRYFAMDRDNRWERTKRAYDLYVSGRSNDTTSNAIQALQDAYKRGETDEFVTPTQIGHGNPIATGDDVIFMNFRADRVRQLARAFLSDNDDATISRPSPPKLHHFVCLTPYADDISQQSTLAEQVHVAFEPAILNETLPAILSNSGKTQLRIAETEKYAHVTYFFSGGTETPLPGETRQIVPSPSVATYDLQPTMSAPEVCTQIVDAIRTSRFDFIVCNFANADMVGHTGDFNAATQAVECIDDCLAKITTVVRDTNSHCVITADHGNVEEMVNPESEQPHTAHTVGVVPFVYVGPNKPSIHPHGGLADVAPCMLSLMGIPQPEAMTGRSLFH